MTLQDCPLILPNFLMLLGIKDEKYENDNSERYKEKIKLLINNLRSGDFKEIKTGALIIKLDPVRQCVIRPYLIDRLSYIMNNLKYKSDFYIGDESTFCMMVESYKNNPIANVSIKSENIVRELCNFIPGYKTNKLTISETVLKKVFDKPCFKKCDITFTDFPKRIEKKITLVEPKKGKKIALPSKKSFEKLNNLLYPLGVIDAFMYLGISRELPYSSLFSEFKKALETKKEQIGCLETTKCTESYFNELFAKFDTCFKHAEGLEEYCQYLDEIRNDWKSEIERIFYIATLDGELSISSTEMIMDICKRRSYPRIDVWKFILKLGNINKVLIHNEITEIFNNDRRNLKVCGYCGKISEPGTNNTCICGKPYIIPECPNCKQKNILSAEECPTCKIRVKDEELVVYLIHAIDNAVKQKRLSDSENMLNRAKIMYPNWAKSFSNAEESINALKNKFELSKSILDEVDMLINKTDYKNAQLILTEKNSFIKDSEHNKRQVIIDTKVKIIEEQTNQIIKHIESNEVHLGLDRLNKLLLNYPYSNIVMDAEKTVNYLLKPVLNKISEEQSSSTTVSDLNTLLAISSNSKIITDQINAFLNRVKDLQSELYSRLKEIKRNLHKGKVQAANQLYTEIKNNFSEKDYGEKLDEIENIICNTQDKINANLLQINKFEKEHNFISALKLCSEAKSICVDHYELNQSHKFVIKKLSHIVGRLISEGKLFTAKEKIAEISSVIEDKTEVNTIITNLNSKEEEYLRDYADICNLTEENKYFLALKKIEVFDNKYPEHNYGNYFTSIKKQCCNFDSDYEKIISMLSSDSEQAYSLLTKLNVCCVDHPLCHDSLICIAPPPPISCKGTINNDACIISWNMPSHLGNVSCEVMRSTQTPPWTDKNFTIIGSAPAGVGLFKDDSITSGVQYYYGIMTSRDEATADTVYTAESVFYTPPPKIKDIVIADSMVKISLTLYKNCTRVLVQRSSTNDNDEIKVFDATKAGDIYDENLVDNCEYNYQFIAEYSNHNFSAQVLQSEPINAKVVPCRKPIKIDDLKYVVNNRSVTLTWSPPTGEEESYILVNYSNSENLQEINWQNLDNYDEIHPVSNTVSLNYMLADKSQMKFTPITKLGSRVTIGSSVAFYNVPNAHNVSVKKRASGLVINWEWPNDILLAKVAIHDANEEFFFQNVRRVQSEKTGSLTLSLDTFKGYDLNALNFTHSCIFEDEKANEHSSGVDFTLLVKDKLQPRGSK